jgi:hypothetical protein
MAALISAELYMEPALDYILQAVSSIDPDGCQIHIQFQRGHVTHKVRGRLSPSQFDAYQTAVSLVASHDVDDLKQAVHLLEATGFEVMIVR